jgi:hypothetical protein
VIVSFRGGWRGSEMGTKFRTMLAPVNVSTGDRRRFASGAITLAPTPFPLEWARERQGGHDGAVSVGVVQEAFMATIDDAIGTGLISEESASSLGLDMSTEAVWAVGEFFDDVDREEHPKLAEAVADAMYLVDKGTLGPSVDLDSFNGYPVKTGTDDELTMDDFETAERSGEDLEVELLIDEGRVRAATLVSIPAFAETVIPMSLDTGDSLVASVIGSTDLPVAGTDVEWDGSAATDRVFDHYTDGDTVDTEGISRAFLYRDPGADLETQAAYKLGFADIVGGELTIVPRGVAACAGGRGVDATDIPDDERGEIKNKICSLYSTVRNTHEDWPECPYEKDNGTSEALIASLSSSPHLPEATVFDPPELTEPTPVTIDFETGRIFGHIAEWRTCHGGIPDVCVTPPHDDGEYAWFHRSPVETSGGIVWAGRLTVGGVHPGLELSAVKTISAYDSKITAAYVRATEDDHGILISGVLAPDLTDNVRQVLSRRKVSGDWRETDSGLSLVELLALSPGPREHSEPGFPVAIRSHHGRQVALTASFGPDPDRVVQMPDLRSQIREQVRIERKRDEALAALRSYLENDREARMDRARNALTSALEG